MSTRDVNLVIKAKDEGSKSVENFTGFLKKLTDVQGQIANSSTGAGAALANFGKILDQVTTSSAGDAAKTASTVASAYDRLSEASVHVASTMERQRSSLAESKAGYAALAAQIKSAEEALVNIATARQSAVAAGEKGDGERLAERERVATNALKGLRVEYGNLGKTIEAQTASIAESEATLGRLERTAAVAQIAVRSTGAAAATAAPQVSNLARTTREVGVASVEASKKTGIFKGAVQELYGASRQSLSLFQRLRGEVLSLGASFVGFYGIIQNIGGVIESYRQLETAQNRLGVAFNQDSTAVSTEMTFLRQEADRLGIVFTDLAKAYGSITINARMAGLSTGETRNLFLSLAEAGRVVGLSQDDMNAVFKAFEQIMNKGKFSAEELRGQLGERLPGAVRILSSALGVTTQELDKMMQAGEVLADRNTIGLVADRLREQFGPQLQAALQNTTTEIGRFQNNLKDAQLRVAEGGFIDGLTVALRELNTWFKSDDGVNFFTGLGQALGKFAMLVPPLVQNIDKLLMLFQVFAAAKFGAAFVALGGGADTMKAQFIAADSAIKRFIVDMQLLSTSAISGGTSRAVFATIGSLGILSGTMATVTVVARAMWVAIGGLPGLIITGITFALSSLLGSWLTGVDSATAALQRHEDMLNRIRNAYVAAGDDVEVLRAKLAEMSKIQLQGNVEDLKEQLDDVRTKLIETAWDKAWSPLTEGSVEGRNRLVELTAALNEGKISVSEYKRQLDELGTANPDLDRHLIRQLLDAADKGVELEDALKMTGAAIRALAGIATEADLKLLGLANGFDSTNAAADSSAIDNFNSSLEDLIALAPSAAGAMRDIQRAQQAQTAYENAVASARGKQASSNIADVIQGTIDEQVANATYNAVINDIKQNGGEARSNRRGGGGGGGSRSDGLQTETQSLDEAGKALQEYRRGWEAYLESAWNDIQLLTLDARERQIQTEIIRRNTEAQQAGRELQANGLYLYDEELNQIRMVEGAKWDAANADRIREEAAQEAIRRRQEAQRAAEESVSQAQEKRRLLEERLTLERARGDVGAAKRTQEEIKALDGVLDAAIEKAIEFWRVFGGEGAENAIIALQNMREEMRQNADQATVTAGQMKQIIGDKLLSAWDSFAQKIAEGKNVWEALSESFLQAAADFLREIARMIAQQIIFNLLSGMNIPGIPGMPGGGGGGSGHIPVSLHHTGNSLAGAASAPRRMADASWFQNARRMHGGGIVGLSPGEVPIIAKDNEGIFTPEQMAAMGGGRGDIKIVNAIDPGDFVSAGMNTRQGEQAVLNWMSSNKSRVKAALA